MFNTRHFSIAQYTHVHGVGRYPVRGDHPSGLQVGTVVLERVSDNWRGSQVRGRRVPRDRHGIFGDVHDDRHGRSGREHCRVRGAVQTGTRRHFYAQRSRPRSLAALRRRGTRVQTRVRNFQFYRAKYRIHNFKKTRISIGADFLFSFFPRYSRVRLNFPQISTVFTTISRRQRASN